VSHATSAGRLKRNFAASFVAKGSAAAYRIAVVPLLLWHLGAERYGDWLVLSALPSWLALSSFSLGSVASSEIALEVARGDELGAKRTFSTTLAALLLVSVVGIAIVGVFLFLIASGSFGVDLLRFHAWSELATIGMLAVAVFVSLFAEPFAAKMRAAGRADLGIQLNAALPWIELACSAVALTVSATIVSLAAATLVSRLIFVVYSWRVSQKANAGIYFQWASVRVDRVWPLLRKGVAYQALPLGHALSNQAMIMVVAAALGPVAVAVFGTARTMARLGVQGMELINFAVWPEMTLLLGGRDYARAAAVHRAAAAYTVAAGAITAVGAITVGPWLFKTWTVGELSVTHSLMAMFGAAIMLQSIWHASLIVQLAVNEHEGVAVRYVIGSLAAVICCWPLSQAFGLYGAAASSMVIDAILIPYCLVKALVITHDTLPQFLAGLVPAARYGLDIVRKRAVSLP
jgi:O-antigen/teichoic acid export membrane protein